jgi:hypothetical protein
MMQAGERRLLGKELCGAKRRWVEESHQRAGEGDFIAKVAFMSTSRREVALTGAVAAPGQLP